MANAVKHIKAFVALMDKKPTATLMRKAQQLLRNAIKTEVGRVRWVKREAQQTFTEYVKVEVEGNILTISVGDFYGRFLDEGIRSNIKAYMDKTKKGIPAGAPNDKIGKVMLEWAKPEKQDELIAKLGEKWLPSGKTPGQLLQGAYKRSVPALKALLLEDVRERLQT